MQGRLLRLMREWRWSSGRHIIAFILLGPDLVGVGAVGTYVRGLVAMVECEHSERESVCLHNGACAI